MAEEEHPVLNMIRSCIVEFLGDLIFVFMGSLQGTAGAHLGVLDPALVHGLTIFILVATMGHISGGHYNPAVSLGVFLAGGIGVVRLICYVLCQLVGGCVGSFLLRAVVDNITYVEDLKGGMIFPGSDSTILQAIICEAVLTYILVSTVLLVAVDSEGRSVLAPLAIGTCLIVDILTGGNISGASMNPARSFGPAVVYSILDTEMASYAWQYQYVYWAGPIIGALIAALLYRGVFSERQKRWIAKIKPTADNHF